MSIVDGGKKRRIEIEHSLVSAARDYSTAAVMMHDAIAQRFELSAADLKALDVLQRTGPVTAGEIAAHTGLATPSVTSLIDRLEKKRLVKRTRDAKDRRRVVVMLTSRLEKEIAPLFATLAKKLAARCRRHSENELRVLHDFFAETAADMRAEVRPFATRRR